MRMLGPTPEKVTAMGSCEVIWLQKWTCSQEHQGKSKPVSSFCYLASPESPSLALKCILTMLLLSNPTEPPEVMSARRIGDSG